MISVTVAAGLWPPHIARALVLNRALAYPGSIPERPFFLLAGAGLVLFSQLLKRAR